MADEDYSQPIVAVGEQATITTVANAVISIKVQSARIEERLEHIGEDVRELRHDISRAATRTELEAHELNCPARSRLRPSQQVSKISWWTTAQQRLGVLVSVLTILGIVVGAWVWSARTFTAVEQKLGEQRKESRKRDESVKRQVQKNLQEVIRMFRDLKKKEGGDQ